MRRGVGVPSRRPCRSSVSLEPGRAAQPIPRVDDRVRQRTTGQSHRDRRVARHGPRVPPVGSQGCPQRQFGPRGHLLLQQELLVHPDEIRIRAGRLRAQRQPLRERGPAGGRGHQQVAFGRPLDPGKDELGEIPDVHELDLPVARVRRECPASRDTAQPPGQTAHVLAWAHDDARADNAHRAVEVLAHGAFAACLEGTVRAARLVRVRGALPAR